MTAVFVGFRLLCCSMLVPFGWYQHGVSLHVTMNLGKHFLRISCRRKNYCDPNLGESLRIFTLFIFADSGLNLLNGFDYLLRSTKWNASLILLRDCAELVALCKVIVWKTHIPVRTQKWPSLLIFAGARHGIVINHVTGHSY